MARTLKSGGLVLQVAIGLLAFSVLAFSPPAQGRMLLLPLTAGHDALDTALRHGAGLVGRGPVSGSIIIQGDLARLGAPLARKGAILLAAPRGCGERGI